MTQSVTKLEQQALANIEKDRVFRSPTWGRLTFKEVIYRLGAFMLQKPDQPYTIIIGTDSQKYSSRVSFVSAIIVHREGGGAIYFWDKEVLFKKYFALEPRMFEEATRSINLAQKFLEEFKIEGITRFDVEIHVDIGSKGKTRELIRAVTGMIEGSGFAVKTKPQAFGAASVADRHT